MLEFSFSYYFSPHQIARHYTTLLLAEKWSPTRLAAYQANRLRLLLRHSGTKVPYYRNLFDALGLSPNDVTTENAFTMLQLLPVLDKDTFRREPAAFLADNVSKLNTTTSHTSGTTGSPIKLHWDSNVSALEVCSIARFWRWAGAWPGQAFLDVRSRALTTDTPGVRRLGTALYLRNWKVNSLEISSDLINRHNIGDYARLILRYRPRLVRGFPESVHHLADNLAAEGICDWKPKIITTHSEPLCPNQREQLVKIWGVLPLDNYGIKERCAFVAECRHHRLHFFPTYGVSEVIDSDGRPVAAGEEGRLIATGLHNFAQPLLRYDTGDFVVMSKEETCPCGCKYPMALHITGREEDSLINRQGTRFRGMSLAFLGIPGLKQARLVQKSPDKVLVEISTTNEFDSAARKRLQQQLTEKVYDTLAFELSVKQRIRQTDIGKYRFVVSDF